MKRILPFALLAVIIGVLATSFFFLFPKTSPVADTKTTSNLVVILHRTTCYGTCPSYQLVILGDGTVIYEGYDYVETVGIRTAELSQDKIAQLVTAINKANFFDFGDYISRDITDTAWAITSVTLDGKYTWTVEHYYGDKNAPQELTELEAKIDEITNSYQWTGK